MKTYFQKHQISKQSNKEFVIYTFRIMAQNVINKVRIKEVLVIYSEKH